MNKWAVVLLLLLFCSCARTHQSSETLLQQDTDLMRYADNVAVYRTDYGYSVDVLNPWDSTAMLGRYAFVPDSLNVTVPSDRIVIRTPVKSVVSYSATQWSVFLQLDEISRIKCILEGRYVHNEEMKALLKEGKVLDVGTEAGVDIERLIEIKPDVILYSPYFDGNQGGLKITGAVLFPFADYLEPTPLGRSEWIRVVGLLTCRETSADNWFNDIERRYMTLKNSCDSVAYRPLVFSGKPFNGQWYVAGGRSYIAELFADAGTDYVWKDNTSTASFPLDGEIILSKAQHADFWRINNSSTHPLTYEQLGSENTIHPLFDAFKNKKVIVCDVQQTGYFEQSQCEPDLLLADFIYFFHPECLKGEWKDYRPKYYHWLEE